MVCPSEIQRNVIQQPLFTFRQTIAAGLSAFSLCAIPKETTILTVPGPYASVMMRKWRKEICAWCFRWRYSLALTCNGPSTSKAAWPIPVEARQGGRKHSHFLPGLWHCSSSCLGSWIRDLELWEGEGAQWVANILEGFERAFGESTRRERESHFAKSAGRGQDDVVRGTVSQAYEMKLPTEERANVLEYLSKDMADVDISTAEITPEFLDRVWGEVEDISSGLKRSARRTSEGKKNQGVSVSNLTTSPTMSLYDQNPQSISPGPSEEFRQIQTSGKKSLVPMARLNELELDTARFVLEAMIRHVREQIRTNYVLLGSCAQRDSETQEFALDSPPLRSIPQLSTNNMSNPGLWEDFMLLQNNELEYLRSKPYMLAAGIKIYAFLRGMVRDISEQGKFGRQEGLEDRRRRRAQEILSSGLETSESVRAILGRDPGNVFGIWEEGEGEESEMYGWGAYVFGSFFNHGNVCFSLEEFLSEKLLSKDCNPNLKKRRIGRSVEFYTLRDVKEGDELGIAYVDVEGVDGDRETRNTRLREHWFFSCRCESCAN